MLSINGIGNETVDFILLYGANKLSFITHQHTYRIIKGHLIYKQGYDYEKIKYIFEKSLPKNINVYKKYHGSIVEIGRNYCFKKTQIVFLVP